MLAATRVFSGDVFIFLANAVEEKTGQGAAPAATALHDMAPPLVAAGTNPKRAAGGAGGAAAAGAGNGSVTLASNGGRS